MYRRRRHSRGPRAWPGTWNCPWLRGGGGNFGIVTSFEFDVHPAGRTVFSGLVAWPAEKAREVLTFFRDFAA
ncbi:hypothetical protein [Aquisalimonas sp.]|uniref:hypothetical protein n=1 Tax=Aquisalimonas sp. TaxID=1872621 RepID=UPI0025C45CA6|nr:hypothetical protein [Aquisalimonas sp.]